ncbi:MAG TPA: pyrroline-5-carboxylate reductase dimerization domain-containing protein [Solirubrobacteraceae bacterium]|jgi:pyrroline-5-carboxylate reductase|nr:pyrroline-5-carboxylate reductase dimerization domain-containing protein [Solirubrobacteraceae bacterium]
MQIGLIGAGNMARALARGWGRPVLCFDPVAERARALAEETGGEALASNADVASRAELVVLCHKPAQLRGIAEEVAPKASAVASILAATPLAEVREAYPGRPVYRFIPSLPVEVRQGAVVQAADPEREAAAHIGDLAGDAVEATATGELAVNPIEATPSGDGALDAQVRQLFAELGTLVVLDDALLDVATGLMSCAPAYVALIAEAQVDAGVRRGIPAHEGARLVVQTLAGTAELLRRRDYDTLALRREVSSPGGLTARGVAALERAGVRAAFSDALDAVLRRRGPGAGGSRPQRGRRG